MTHEDRIRESLEKQIEDNLIKALYVGHPPTPWNMPPPEKARKLKVKIVNGRLMIYRPAIVLDGSVI